MGKITKRDIKNTLKKMLVVPENPLLEGALALLKKLECELAEVDESLTMKQNPSLLLLLMFLLPTSWVNQRTTRIIVYNLT